MGSWLTVTPIKSILLAKEERLRYQLSFEPLKPTNTLVEFVVLRKSGGRSAWSHIHTRCITHYANHMRNITRGTGPSSHEKHTTCVTKHCITHKAHGITHKAPAPLHPAHAHACSLAHLCVYPWHDRWRYELRLEATEPEPDDTILIEAGINTTTIVNFRLTNRHLAFAPFQVCVW